MTSWQVCPVCKGHSVNQDTTTIELAHNRCGCCDNTGIINTLTGHPPVRRHNVDASLIRQIKEKAKS